MKKVDFFTKFFLFIFPFSSFVFVFFVITKSPATYYDLDSIIPLLGCLLALVLFLGEKSEYKKDMEHTQQ